MRARQAGERIALGHLLVPISRRSDSSAAFPSYPGGWPSRAEKVAAPGPRPCRRPPSGPHSRARADASGPLVPRVPERKRARRGSAAPLPRVLQQSPPPAGDFRSALPSPSRDSDVSFSERVLAREQAAHPLVTTPAFHLAESEGRAHSFRPSFLTHFSSAMKKLALLPIQKGTRLPLRVSVSGVPSRCESTAIRLLLREAPRPAFLPPRSLGGRDTATSATAAAAAEPSPFCVEEEPWPPPCGQAGGGEDEGEGRRASGGGAEQPS